MESQFASMHALDPGGGSLRLLSAQGFGAAAIRAFATADVSQPGTFGAALRLGERVVVGDIAAAVETRSSPELQACLRFGIHTMQSTPLVSRSGRMLGVLSTYWDNTCTPSERQLRLLDVLARQAADLVERGEAEATLLQADRRKDEFLATLAHELRNPLAPMRTAIDLMKLKRTADTDMARARDIIDRQLAHMTRLLDDLLDVSRIARGKLSLRRERVDLCDVIRNAVESCAPLVERMSHDLSVGLPTRPVWVSADPVRLCQVLGNLLNNACRYTKPGGRLRLDVAESGGEVAVGVSDSGIGIAPENLGAIFDIFSQIGDTDSTQNGLGIGLYIVRQIVAMHGGRVEATSEGIGRGSRFVVRLPVLEAAGRQAPDQQRQEDGVEAEIAASSRSSRS
jgi:signal transduction histidine kinase